MPKIECSKKQLDNLLEKNFSKEELEDLLVYAKAEVDNLDDDVLKIELNDTNRPDLWSLYGVVRSLRAALGKRRKTYNFFDKKATKEVRVENNIRSIRPFMAGFIAKGVKVDDSILDSLIQSQEKICHNFGRKRKSIAMGIYRNNLIQYPIHYRGADPDKESFKPLGMDENLSLREILKVHPKGQEYGHIIENEKLFPLLHDDKGRVLSMPPVINSNEIGSVEIGDNNLCVEVTGTVLNDLFLAVNIMACDMADMGFQIEPLKIIYSDNSYTTPTYFQKPAFAKRDYINKMLGVELSKTKIEDALKKMAISSIVDKNKVQIRVPEYRNDFLHQVDVIEDIMIGLDLNSFEPSLPSDFTMGGISEAEERNRKVKDILVGLGFQEMMYNYLGSYKTYVSKMNLSEHNYIQILNPMSENYEYVRPSILPSLLESESVSAAASFPHKLFECGKVAFKNKEDNSGTSTYNYLGFSLCEDKISYNDISSVISNLFYFLDVKYELTLREDPRFLTGRAANIIVNGKQIGYFGEVHPKVLTNWNITTPVSAAEINLDFL